jgi:hypothetical protein
LIREQKLIQTFLPPTNKDPILLHAAYSTKQGSYQLDVTRHQIASFLGICLHFYPFFPFAFPK